MSEHFLTFPLLIERIQAILCSTHEIEAILICNCKTITNVFHIFHAANYKSYLFFYFDLWFHFSVYIFVYFCLRHNVKKARILSLVYLPEFEKVNQGVFVCVFGWESMCALVWPVERLSQLLCQSNANAAAIAATWEKKCTHFPNILLSQRDELFKRKSWSCPDICGYYRSSSSVLLKENDLSSNLERACISRYEVDGATTNCSWWWRKEGECVFAWAYKKLNREWIEKPEKLTKVRL